MMKIEEVGLSKSEAEILGEAFAEVSKHYPTAITDKQMAWVNLGISAATITASHAYVYNARMKREKAERIASSSPTQEAVKAAAFVEPGFPGGIGPVSDASGF